VPWGACKAIGIWVPLCSLVRPFWMIQACKPCMPRMPSKANLHGCFHGCFHGIQPKPFPEGQQPAGCGEQHSMQQPDCISCIMPCIMPHGTVIVVHTIMTALQQPAPGASGCIWPRDWASFTQAWVIGGKMPQLESPTGLQWCRQWGRWCVCVGERDIGRSWGSTVGLFVSSHACSNAVYCLGAGLCGTQCRSSIRCISIYKAVIWQLC